MMHLCPHCDNVYNSKSNLKRHVKVGHVKKEWPCPDCPNIYKRADYVLKHRRNQHGYAEVERRMREVKLGEKRRAEEDWGDNCYPQRKMPRREPASPTVVAASKPVGPPPSPPRPTYMEDLMGKQPQGTLPRTAAFVIPAATLVPWNSTSNFYCVGPVVGRGFFVPNTWEADQVGARLGLEPEALEHFSAHATQDARQQLEQEEEWAFHPIAEEPLEEVLNDIPEGPASPDPETEDEAISVSSDDEELDYSFAESEEDLLLLDGEELEEHLRARRDRLWEEATGRPDVQEALDDLFG